MKSNSYWGTIIHKGFKNMKKSTAQIQKCVVLSHSFAEYASSSLLFEYIVNSFKNIFPYRQGKEENVLGRSD